MNNILTVETLLHIQNIHQVVAKKMIKKKEVMTIFFKQNGDYIFCTVASNGALVSVALIEDTQLPNTQEKSLSKRFLEYLSENFVILQYDEDHLLFGYNMSLFVLELHELTGIYYQLYNNKTYVFKQGQLQTNLSIGG